ncbi:hypothetical protein B0A52_08808 [Exophiala mesophila]|uniref:AB hydrolase-1 domain-containing protein n=1 Tax=Exophiala mesophila TaxID=212818 RepID=A0A438MUN1_EXOME|nr:hypothetical protein B0A52_08808 [Exophiala mesophila]
MLQLNPDPSFHFELLRVIAGARGLGADVGEVLNVCEKIVPGDFESWYREFRDLGAWVESTIDEDRDDKVSLRDAYWRASRYHFASAFFFQKESEDDRASTIFDRWRALFQKGTRHMEIPPEYLTLNADGFQIPVILFKCATDDKPRPVLIIGNGLDGSMEEMFHMNGIQALERGYHVVLYEGPGQPSVRRAQNIGFIHDWERVVTPIVDHLQSLSYVQSNQITLFGNSLGGYLAARAAAFEQRLAAVILVDGLYDLGDGLDDMYGSEILKIYQEGDQEGFNNAAIALTKKSTKLSFLINQISWAFMLDPYQAHQVCKKMSLRGIEDKIKCPVFIAGAENDIFDKIDQPGAVKAALSHLGERATLKRFTAQEAADAHCHVGATAFSNQVILGWLETQLGATSVVNGHGH